MGFWIVPLERCGNKAIRGQPPQLSAHATVIHIVGDLFGILRNRHKFGMAALDEAIENAPTESSQAAEK